MHAYLPLPAHTGSAILNAKEWSYYLFSIRFINEVNP
jgi:hypothetical protein